MEGAALTQVNTQWMLGHCPRVSIPAPATPVHFQFHPLILNTTTCPSLVFSIRSVSQSLFCVLCSGTSRTDGDDSFVLQWWGGWGLSPLLPQGLLWTQVMVPDEGIELIPVLWAEVTGQVCSLPAQ